jgi:uncharacterized protein (DUF2062 family)
MPDTATGQTSPESQAGSSGDNKWSLTEERPHNNECPSRKEPGTVKHWLRKAYYRLVKIDGTPRQISLGLALGIFLGILPIFGFQALSAVLLASLLKWSKIAAALGSGITNPLTTPFIYSAAYYIGSRLFGTRLPPLNINELGFGTLITMFHSSPQILWNMFVGSIFLALPLAIAGYYVTYAILERHQDKIREKIILQKEKLTQKSKKLVQETIALEKKLLEKTKRRKMQKSSKKK